MSRVPTSRTGSWSARVRLRPSRVRSVQEPTEPSHKSATLGARVASSPPLPPSPPPPPPRRRRSPEVTGGRPPRGGDPSLPPPPLPRSPRAPARPLRASGPLPLYPREFLACDAAGGARAGGGRRRRRGKSGARAAAAAVAGLIQRFFFLLFVWIGSENFFEGDASASKFVFSRWDACHTEANCSWFYYWCLVSFGCNVICGRMAWNLPQIHCWFAGFL